MDNNENRRMVIEDVINSYNKMKKKNRWLNEKYKGNITITSTLINFYYFKDQFRQILQSSKLPDEDLYNDKIIGLAFANLVSNCYNNNLHTKNKQAFISMSNEIFELKK